ncbi:hypothetical protein CR513_19258, partial [Mucuna pruriens]
MINKGTSHSPFELVYGCNPLYKAQERKEWQDVKPFIQGSRILTRIHALSLKRCSGHASCQGRPQVVPAVKAGFFREMLSTSPIVVVGPSWKILSCCPLTWKSTASRMYEYPLEIGNDPMKSIPQMSKTSKNRIGCWGISCRQLMVVPTL